MIQGIGTCVCARVIECVRDAFTDCRVISCAPMDELDNAEDDHNRLWLLSGLVLRRHSTIGLGRRYSASQIHAMWSTTPQNSTSVHVVTNVTEAGGTNVTTNTRTRKKGM